jgi:hypothetical protein
MLTQLVVDPDGNLLVAGSFTHVNGTARRGIARIVTRAPQRLANISTRARVGTGEAVQIGGFIITGAGPKPVLVRGIGPSLAAHGVAAAETLQNPTIELRSAAGSLIGSNRDWRDSQAAEIDASGAAPSNEREAAIIATLQPGAYTAMVSDESGGTGLGLVEIYDLDLGGASRLANISTRGRVDAAEDVMIGGFILGGSEPSPVVLRGLGPSLAAESIDHTLRNPSLSLHNSSGDVVAANDDWTDSQRAELEAIQMAPANVSDSALITTLPSGSYTVILRGAPGDAGVGLVEVYQLE